MAKKKRTMFVIHRGNPDVEGVAVKMNAINVVVRFVKMVLPKTEMLIDKNTILVVMPDNNVGNTAWVKDNVFKFVDILGTVGDDEAESRAKRAYDRYQTLEKKGDEVGSGIITYYLQQFYLIEKSASVFEVDL